MSLESNATAHDAANDPAFEAFIAGLKHPLSTTVFAVLVDDRPAANDDGGPPVADQPSPADTAKRFAFTTASTAVAGPGKWPAAVEHDLKFIHDIMLDPKQRAQKDGLCFVPGTLNGTTRKKEAVASIDVLVYDIDGGQALDGPGGIDEILEEAGLFGWVYSTYSHQTTKTKISADHYDKWARKSGAPVQSPPLSAIVDYLKANKKDHVAAANPVFDMSTPDGIKKHFEHTDAMYFVVYHDPLEKYRVVLPLKNRVVLSDLAMVTRKAIDAYKSIYHGVGQALGLVYDSACEDPSRLFYFPAIPPGTIDKYVVREYGNIDNPNLLDWRDEQRWPRADVKSEESSSSRQRLSSSSRKHRAVYVVTDKDGVTVDLCKLPPDFDIEDLLQQTLPDDCIKDARAESSGGGFHVECPFEANHTKSGGLGTFAANSDGEKAWTIYCSHNSCSDHGKFDYLKEFVEAGWVTAEDLGLAPAELHVVDADGAGLDVSKYVKATGDERSATDLAEAIRAGEVAVAGLIDMALAAEVPPADPYAAALRALAIESPTLTRRDVEKRKTDIGHEHKAGKRIVDGDYKDAVAAIEAREAELGRLTRKEAEQAAKQQYARPEAPRDTSAFDVPTLVALEGAGFDHGWTVEWSDDLQGFVTLKGEGIPVLLSSRIEIVGRGYIGTKPHLIARVQLTTGEWVTKPIDLADLATNPEGKIRALGIRTAQAKQLSSILAAVVTDDHVQVVAQPGWYGDGDSYVMPNGEVIGPDAIYPLFGPNESLGTLGYDVGGTMEGANELMAAIEGQHRTQLVTALSSSAEIAGKMGIEMAAVLLWGTSAGGKSTTLNVGMSPRARGATQSQDPKKGSVRSANFTEFAATKIAESRNCSVMTADELKVASPDVLESLAYVIPNGASKAAGKSSGDLRDASSWSTLLLMTGELTLREQLESAKLKYFAGQASRVVELYADAGKGLGVFEFVPEGFDSLESYACWLNEMAKTHYGHHTRALIAEYQKDPQGFEEAALAAAERVVLDTGGNAQVARVARRWASMIGITIVAAERGIFPWSEASLIKATQVCFAAWVEARGGTASGEVLEAERAFGHYVWKNPGAFSDEQHDSPDPSRNRVGVRNRVMVGGELFIEYQIPDLESLAETLGGQAERCQPFLEWLREGKSDQWELSATKGFKKKSRKIGGMAYVIRSKVPRDIGDDDEKPKSAMGLAAEISASRKK